MAKNLQVVHLICQPDSQYPIDLNQLYLQFQNLRYQIPRLHLPI